MHTTEVKILLKKYYEGGTTLQEERQLEAYLLSPGADPQFAAEAQMFGHFAKAKQETLPPAVTEKIENRLQHTASIPFYRSRQLYYYVGGIAAALLLLFTLTITFYQRPADTHFVAATSYTHAETEAAFLQTQQALAYVGAKFTQGAEPLKKLDKLQNTQVKMQNLGAFDRNIKTINHKMDKASESLDDLGKLSKFKIVFKP
ncbi:MAG TPA: hypothetical protein VFC92_01570 [Bacteroidales bacterium]|nr:hypothetical protein [Bacteroidales bacterium]